MKCFEIVGTLLDGKEIYREEEGEVFYKANIKVLEDTFTLICSEYIIKEPGKVKVTGFVSKENRDDSRLNLFISCKNMISVDEETPDSNGVVVGGRVCYVKDFVVQQKDGLEILVFDLKYYSYDTSHNVLRCVAKGKIARELRELKRNDILELSGELQRHKEQIEVLVSSIDYRESDKPKENEA